MRRSLVRINYYNQLAYPTYIFFYFRNAGGIEAEQAMRIKLNREEQTKISDSVNALMEMRKKKSIEVTSLCSENTNNRNADISLNNYISSKDYYNEYDSENDSSDNSTDETAKVNQLVCEININKENECQCDVSKLTRDRQLIKEDNIREIVKENQTDCFININDSKENHENKTDVQITGKKEINEVTSYINNQKCVIDHSQILYSNNAAEMINFNEDMFVSEINCVKNESISENDDKSIKIQSIFSDNDFCSKDGNSITSNKQNIHYSSNVKQSVRNDEIFNNYNFEKSENLIVSEKKSQKNNSMSTMVYEDSSQLLCSKEFNNFKIISDFDNEINLTSTKSDENKIEEIPIQLPWKQSHSKEIFFIKKHIE